MAKKQIKMEMGVGVSIIQNFADHPHTLYKALAEFIDNSIQAYFDEEPKIKKILRKRKEKLFIRINYNKAKKTLQIIDNSTGIYEDVLRQAFRVGTKVDRKNADKSLGQFNMGFKTAAVWLCEIYTIETKRFDEEKRLNVIVDHRTIDPKDATLSLDAESDIEKGNKSYTRFLLEDLKHDFSNDTINLTKSHLASTYRHLSKSIDIFFDGEQLVHEPLNLQINEKTGKEFKWQLDRGYLNPNDRNSPEISGWVGILRLGTKAMGGSTSALNAGFDIFRRNRMIMGWPEPWQPPISMSGGSNTSENQRITGEIFCDQAKVSFSKDYIDPEHLVLIDTYLNRFIQQNDIKVIAKAQKDPRKKSTSTKNQQKKDAKVIKMKLQGTNIGGKTILPIPADDLIKLKIEQAFQDAAKSDVTTISLNNINLKYLFSHQGEDADFVLYDVQGGSAKDIYVLINRDHPYLLKNVLNEVDYAEFICCMCIARYKIEKDDRLTMDNFFYVLNDVLTYE